MSYTPPYPPIINKSVSIEGSLSTGNTTADLDVSGMTCVEIEVINKTGASTINFTVGTTSVPPSNPTTTNSDKLPASISSKTLPNNWNGTIRVILTSGGTPDYAIVARGY